MPQLFDQSFTRLIYQELRTYEIKPSIQFYFQVELSQVHTHNAHENEPFNDWAIGYITSWSMCVRCQGEYWSISVIQWLIIIQQGIQGI
jgi:hypothetical protein